LPIYYIEVPDLDVRDDPVSRAMGYQQYEDWRELRTVGRTSIKVRKAIENLAKRIRDLLQGVELPQQLHLPVVPLETSREYRAQAAETDAQGGDWIDYGLIAQAAFDDEEYGLARALLLEALDRFPNNNPELMHELAKVDWYDGALHVAVLEFEAALAAGIDRIEVLQGLGQARVELGDFKRGIEELTDVVEHHPDHDARAYARSTRALGFGGIRRFEEALEELAAAERETPDNAWLHFNRARVLDWQGDHAAIASYIRSLVLSSPPLNRPKRQMAQRRLLELGWASVTTLVTGFEPFGGSNVNSSELIVTALATLGERGVITAVLPTSYRRAEARIGELLYTYRPRTLLMLGLAEDADTIRLEQVALNLDDSDAPDNDGEIRLQQCIVEGAPVSYRSTLQLNRMADAASNLGEDVNFSDDAGGYVCNHAFFIAAHLVATEFPGSRCGLVHLPAVQGADERLTRLRDIVRTWIAEP
jgi:pyroglutamyl-peptidase